ncbi:MAG: YlxR family protein [Caldimicrobium sp.]
MLKKGHIPERTCVACRIKAPKWTLVRFVARDGEILLDEKGIMPGRGAYLCKNCLPKKDQPKILKKLKKALRISEK